MRATYSHFWRIGAIRLGASAFLCAVLGNTVSAQIVYPAPPLVIQDVQWTSGTHHYSQSPAIVAPDDPGHPVEVSGTADAEFVSGTAVHLTDGFQAGSFTGDGQFRARIGDQYGDPQSIVLIPSEPGAQIVDGVVHVPKWEKLEIGIELPQEYQDAIESFFANYYSNGSNAMATPSNTDATHDLNPYADDSLQLLLTLTKPSGAQSLKWGFYMKEAQWNGPEDWAILEENQTGPLSPYHVRFRFAPDEEGLWEFSLSIKAPYTSDFNGEPLRDLLYTEQIFMCTAPEPDNHGYLRVNQENNRVLQFQDGTSFFGLGVNLADVRGGPRGSDVPAGVDLSSFFRIRQDLMREAMEHLKDVGGNYVRMFLLRQNFAPEWVNLGVYDHYYSPNPCTNGPSVSSYTRNGQFHCWSFDQLLDNARENDIYVQLCIDPYMPGIAGETNLWGNHPYVRHFLEPSSPTRPYNVKSFFFEDGDPDNKDDGSVFYYWKRKYKYIMSRWGYSVNLAVLEPFNEIDQMLTYRTVEDVATSNSICGENRFTWSEDSTLPIVLDAWLSDVADFVREPVDFEDPTNSSLGENSILFLANYAWIEPQRPDRETFYKPFYNPKVDLMDCHMYLYSSDAQEDTPDEAMHDAVSNTHGYWQDYPQKPFNIGEFNYATEMEYGAWKNGIEKIFHNYNISLHNELWASAFSGRFSAGATWNWDRVFAWPNNLWVALPDDDENEYQQENFSYALGDHNLLDIGVEGLPATVVNRRIHHQFRPLADLLAHPSWQAYDFFNAPFTPHKAFDDTDDDANELEAYYLKDASNTVAIGWVHNRNAWTRNDYYFRSNRQNFLGCTPPDPATSSSLTLDGFAAEMPFHVTWFATWLNSTVHPHAMEITSDNTGRLVIDLTGEFGGVLNNYLDTLHADYAFIVTPVPFTKSRPIGTVDDESAPVCEWNFELFPNPANEVVFLRMPEEGPKEILLIDLAGRTSRSYTNMTGQLVQLQTNGLARGTYAVRVSDGHHTRTRRLIIQ